MKIVADFHIHSRHSRAVSREMSLENLDKWAKIKGIHILGTGDFTHPKWFKEIAEKLEAVQDEPGLFVLKKEFVQESIGRLEKDFKPRFVLTTEVSCIYSKGGKVRRVHFLIFMPRLEDVRKLNAKLSFIGNLSSDGRPILGLDSKELLKICLDVSKDSL